MALLFNTSLSNDSSKEKDILLENIIALNQAQAETGGTGFRCYSTTNNCWFINCTSVYRCGHPCVTVKSDEWTDSNVCP
jgi:hypothetical protein